jgi:hypothetical protein
MSGSENDEEEHTLKKTSKKKMYATGNKSKGKHNNGYHKSIGVTKANEKYQRLRTLQFAAQLLESSTTAAITTNDSSAGPPSSLSLLPTVSSSTIALSSAASAIIDSILSSPQIRQMLPSLLVAAARSPILESSVRNWLDGLLSPINIAMANQRRTSSKSSHVISTTSYIFCTIVFEQTNCHAYAIVCRNK